MAIEKFSKGLARSGTLLMVVLIAVEVEEIAELSLLPFPATAIEERLVLLLASLFVPPDIPEVRDPSLTLPSENGNFPPRGDLRLEKQ